MTDFVHVLLAGESAVINRQLRDMAGDSGIIAIDRKGNIVLSFNTPGMHRASVDVDGKLDVRIFKND